MKPLPRYNGRRKFPAALTTAQKRVQSAFKGIETIHGRTDLVRATKIA